MAELKKALGLKEVTLYGIGVILGAGIYALIGKGAGLTGNSLWMSFFFGAVIASFTGLAYGELSSMFPKEAAEYVYTKKAFGFRPLAFMISWVILIAGIAAIATVALGFAGYFVYLFLGSVSLDLGSFFIFSLTLEVLVAMLLVAVMSLINYKGIRESAWLNIAFTLVEVGGLLFIIFIGIPHLGSVNYFELPAGVSGLMGAMAVMFFAYIGFEDMANISEEVKNAKKTVPKAIVIALVVTTVIYILVALSAVSVVSSAELAASEAPLALVAEQGFAGGGLVLAVIALFATANTVLVFLIVQSRMAYGVAKDGSLPGWLANIHPKTQTPHLAVFTIMILSILFCALSNIQTMAELANFGVFTTFLLVNLAHIVLRYKQPNKNRPFKTPLNIGWFPVISFLGVLTCLIALASYFVKLTDSGVVFVLSDSVVFFGLLAMTGVVAFFLMDSERRGKLNGVYMFLLSLSQYFIFMLFLIFFSILTLEARGASMFLSFLFVLAVVVLPYLACQLSRWKKALKCPWTREFDIPFWPDETRTKTDKHVVGYLYPVSFMGIVHAFWYNLATLVQFVVFSFVLAFPFSMFLADKLDFLTPLIILGLEGVRVLIREREHKGYFMRHHWVMRIIEGTVIVVFVVSIFFFFLTVLFGAPMLELFLGAAGWVIELLWLFALGLVFMDVYTAVGLEREGKKKQKGSSF